MILKRIAIALIALLGAFTGILAQQSNPLGTGCTANYGGVANVRFAPSLAFEKIAGIRGNTCGITVLSIADGAPDESIDSWVNIVLPDGRTGWIASQFFVIDVFPTFTVTPTLTSTPTRVPTLVPSPTLVMTPTQEVISRLRVRVTIEIERLP